MKPCAYVKILEGKEIGDSLGLGGWDLKWRESCGIEPLSQAVSIRTVLNCKTSTAGVHQELENWLVSEELWIKEKAFPFISHLLFKVASNELPHMFLFESKDLMNITVCWAQITWSGCNHDLDRVPIFRDHWYHNLTWGYRQKPLIKKKSGYGENTRCPSMEEWLSKLYVHKMEYYSAKSCELLIHTKAWINLRKLCWVREVRHQRAHCVIPFLCRSKLVEPICGDRRWSQWSLQKAGNHLGKGNVLFSMVLTHLSKLI